MTLYVHPRCMVYKRVMEVIARCSRDLSSISTDGNDPFFECTRFSLYAAWIPTYVRVLSRITPTPIRMERTYATVEKSLHFWRTTALRRRIDHFPVIPKRTLVTDKVTLEMSESESLRTDLDASQGMILQLFLEYIPYL